MAKFYGTLRGCRDSVATKTGTKASGITASVQSWDGSIICEVYERNGETRFRVWFGEGSTSITGGALLVDATPEQLREMSKATKRG